MLKHQLAVHSPRRELSCRNPKLRTRNKQAFILNCGQKYDCSKTLMWFSFPLSQESNHHHAGEKPKEKWWGQVSFTSFIQWLTMVFGVQTLTSFTYFSSLAN